LIGPRLLSSGRGRQTLPDPNCTPGAISPKVTQNMLATTVCRTGYTKSIRPAASIAEIEKRENAAAYGYTGSLKGVEYDHLVPLELSRVTSWDGRWQDFRTWAFFCCAPL
jgi:5-methylcytosine-specific restriction endonuclease McrA